MLHDDATRTLPGGNAVSGSAVGGDAMVERPREIASHSPAFALPHVLSGREDLALSPHNTAERTDAVGDGCLPAVRRLRDGRTAGVETCLPDVPGVNAFSV